MFNWFGNELILTYWQKLSLPLRGVLVDNIVTSVNTRLAGLESAGYLVGPVNRVEWDAKRNVLTDLIDGVVRFHVRMTPPPPAETIEFWMEYEPKNLESLGEMLVTG